MYIMTTRREEGEGTSDEMSRFLLDDCRVPPNAATWNLHTQAMIDIVCGRLVLRPDFLSPTTIVVMAPTPSDVFDAPDNGIIRQFSTFWKRVSSLTHLVLCDKWSTYQGAPAVDDRSFDSELFRPQRPEKWIAQLLFSLGNGRSSEDPVTLPPLEHLEICDLSLDSKLLVAVRNFLQISDSRSNDIDLDGASVDHGCRLTFRNCLFEAPHLNPPRSFKVHGTMTFPGYSEFETIASILDDCCGFFGDDKPF
jgi:hypothetical protein